MELRQLRYLDAVARRRSFTRAAADLHVAQSALSQQVAQLERELGFELLRRTTRRVEVTEAGELVLARARRAFAEVDSLQADLDALQGLVRGTLRLGGVPPVGPVHPAAMITAFAHAHPGVAITVREDVASSLLDGLRQGDLDLVMALTDPSILDGLDGIRLLDDELVLIAPVHHPLTRAKVVRIERLANQPMITTGAGSALRDALIALVPDGHIVAEATDLETVLEFTARGLGVTLMPRSVAAPHSDRLAIRPLHPAQTLPFALIWRANQSFTPAAQAFRDHVLSTLRT